MFAVNTKRAKSTRVQVANMLVLLVLIVCTVWGVMAKPEAEDSDSEGNVCELGGRCGGKGGGCTCPSGQCCSPAMWCGVTAEHCGSKKAAAAGP